MKFNKIIKLIIAFLSLIALLVVVGIGLAYNVTIRNAMSENITLNNNIIIFIIYIERRITNNNYIFIMIFINYFIK